MELGVYTFAETLRDAGAERPAITAERLKHLMEEIKLADEVGLDVFGVGEHHRPDYAVSVHRAVRDESCAGRAAGYGRLAVSRVRPTCVL